MPLALGPMFPPSRPRGGWGCLAGRSGCGEFDCGFSPERKVVLHALVAAGLLDDEPGIDRSQVCVDFLWVKAEAEAGSFEAPAGNCSFGRLLCKGGCSF